MQALHAALRAQPVLLLLDNISPATVVAALPFMAPKHPGSLLIATAWHEQTLTQLVQMQRSQGCTHSHGPVTTFRHRPMAGALLIQPSEADQLVQQQLAAGRHAAGQAPLAAQQLAQLTDEALQLRRPPLVLALAGSMLGHTAHRPQALSALAEQLQAARQPAAPDRPPPSADQTAIRQLRACYNQLPGTAQQLLLDLTFASRMHADRSTVQKFALWLSCRQAAPCIQEDIQAEVSHGVHIAMLVGHSVCKCRGGCR